MVLASVKEGEKIMVARNAHKSVLMGLTLSGRFGLSDAEAGSGHRLGKPGSETVEEDSDNIRTVRLFFW